MSFIQTRNEKITLRGKINFFIIGTVLSSPPPPFIHLPPEDRSVHRKGKNSAGSNMTKSFLEMYFYKNEIVKAFDPSDPFIFLSRLFIVFYI